MGNSITNVGSKYGGRQHCKPDDIALHSKTSMVHLTDARNPGRHVFQWVKINCDFLWNMYSIL